jgi:hypothetical protein
MMRQHFTPQELADHFTLLPAEQELLANKTGANRLGFVVLLKYFQWEGRFPEHVQEVPRAVVDHIARTLTIPGERYLRYDLEGRSARYHKEQIRQWTGFRVGTTADADAITTWLCAHTRVDAATPARLTVRALERYKALHIEPPTPGRLERMTHAAQRTLEEQFFTTLAEALKPETRQRIDTMLTESPSPLSLSALKADAGRRSLDTVEGEVAKLSHLQGLILPYDLLTPLSTRYLQRLKLRVVAETLHELRRHPDPIRYGLVAVFCAVRAQEITDDLTDLLLHVVHKMGVTAEKRVGQELLTDFKRVTGKTGLLFHLAEASLEHPKGQVDESFIPWSANRPCGTSCRSTAPAAAPIGKKSTR